MTRSDTESKKAPRGPAVPEALATAPSRRSGRAQRTRSRRPPRRAPLAMAIAARAGQDDAAGGEVVGGDPGAADVGSDGLEALLEAGAPAAVEHQGVPRGRGGGPGQGIPRRPSQRHGPEVAGRTGAGAEAARNGCYDLAGASPRSRGHRANRKWWAAPGTISTRQERRWVASQAPTAGGARAVPLTVDRPDGGRDPAEVETGRQLVAEVLLHPGQALRHACLQAAGQRLGAAGDGGQLGAALGARPLEHVLQRELGGQRHRAPGAVPPRRPAQRGASPKPAAPAGAATARGRRARRGRRRPRRAAGRRPA